MKCKVNGISGLLLFPDSFTWPTGSNAPAESTATKVNTADDDYTVTYTLAQFATLELAGCVFLPAGGYRHASNVNSAGSGGSYWSSTPDSETVTNACYLSFSSGNVKPTDASTRWNGRNVRLVTDSN